LKEKQYNKCYWCGNEIGLPILKNKNGIHKILELKGHIDHIIPFVFCKNNNIDNLCLSCFICNRWKYSKIFDNPDDCRKYLKYKWDKAVKNNTIIIIE
jgi:CRISPR/Cas system Type II protein with McrA/HNH and RuvC-like nuclease domain